MDAWNPDQLKKMQAGGNGKLNTFFQQYGISKETDIKIKYNNKVAEVRPWATRPARWHWCSRCHRGWGGGGACAPMRMHACAAQCSCVRPGG